MHYSKCPNQSLDKINTSLLKPENLTNILSPWIKTKICQSNQIYHKAEIKGFPYIYIQI